jgi:hypothetical protein
MSMLKVVLALLFFFLGGQASAQIYAVDFSDSKFAKKYKKYLFDYNGKQVILGEIRAGFIEKPEGGYTWNQQSRLEFFIQDKGDPLSLGYSVTEDGERKTTNKKLVLGIAGDRVGKLINFMMNESFYTLSKEYQRRVDLIESMSAAQKELNKTSAAWMSLQMSILLEYENLQTWLFQTGYDKAANKLERDLSKLRKSSEDAKQERFQTALDSIETLKTEKKLIDVASKVGGKDLVFRTQQSQHLLLKYHSGIEDSRVSYLLELGEKAIEAFRNQNVDPYLGEDFVDRIPDGIFLEFFFSTDSVLYQEKLWEEYYGFGWGPPSEKAKRLQMTGTGRHIADRKISYWRIDDMSDLEGIVLHQIGHEIARHHYGILNDTQDWLEEGCGYYLSLMLLNRNNVTCKAFEPPKRQEGTVATGPGSKNEREETKTAVVMQGLREVMAEVALHSKVPFDQLAQKQLYAFQNEDMAKSWAFYEFIVNDKGKAGQEWLRNMTKAANTGRFANLMREHAANQFTIEGQDPMYVIEEWWQEYVRKTFLGN